MTAPEQLLSDDAADISGSPCNQYAHVIPEKNDGITAGKYRRNGMNGK
jgi:hypothetical protein